MESKPFYKDRLFIVAALIILLMLGLTVLSNTAEPERAFQQTTNNAYANPSQELIRAKAYQDLLRSQMQQQRRVMQEVERWSAEADRRSMRRSLEGINRSLRTMQYRQPAGASWPNVSPRAGNHYDY